MAWRRTEGVFWILLYLAFTAAGFTFTRRPSCRQSTRTSHLATGDSGDPLSLMDETVSLYLILSNADNESDDDIVSLRKREIVELVENTIEELSNVGSSTAIDSREKAVDGVAELGRKLDEIILINYQSTFSSEEYDDWVKKVEMFSRELDEKLKDLDSAMPLLPTPISEAQSRRFEGLRVRLNQLKILIPPVRLSWNPTMEAYTTTSNDKFEPDVVKTGEKSNENPMLVDLEAKNECSEPAGSRIHIITGGDNQRTGLAVVSIAVVSAVLGERRARHHDDPTVQTSDENWTLTSH